MMNTESSDKTKNKREERRIFRYILADAWNDMMSQVEVLEGIEDKNIRCLYFDRPRSLTHEGNTRVDSFFTTISQKDINEMKNAMHRHIDIFQYKEIEFPTVLDGVINTFEFILDENFANTITAYNIWAFRGNVDVGIIGTPPYKGSAVLQLFDEISKILLDNGVDPKYLRTD